MRVYPGLDVMGYETVIMLITTKYISLYWSSNVIGKKGLYKKLHVIEDGIFKLPPNKMS